MFIRIILMFSLVLVVNGCSEKNDQQNLLEEAKKNFFNGNYALAVYDLNNYLDNKGKDPEAWKMLGISYAKMGDYEEAYSAFLKAVEKKPSDPSNYAYIAQIFHIDGQYNQAINHFKKSCDMGYGEACQMLINVIAEQANQNYMSPGEVLYYRRNRPRSLNDYNNYD